MPDTLDLSIIVPVYDEEESLGPLDAEIRSALEASGRSAEIIYVDDGSRDGSADVLRTLWRDARGGRFPTRVISLRRNFGQTAAIAAGFDLAKGAIAISMDADRQNDPRDIPRLVAKFDEGFDVVSGWRRHRKDRAISRRLPSAVANWLIRRLTGVELHDFGCTLKAYRTPLLKECRLYGDMHRFIPAYLANLGASIAEIEVEHRPRVTGVSKYGAQRIFKVMLDLVLIRFMTVYYNRPMHFFGQAALVLLALMGVVGTLMVVFKYGWLRLVGIDYQVSFIQTPLPALAASFLIGAISSIFFGILGEVLIRIHTESQGQRPYSIASILDTEAER